MTVVMMLVCSRRTGNASRAVPCWRSSAMSAVLWWRGKSRVMGGMLIVLVGASLIAFMPETWNARMSIDR